MMERSDGTTKGEVTTRTPGKALETTSMQRGKERFLTHKYWLWYHVIVMT